MEIYFNFRGHWYISTTVCFQYCRLSANLPCFVCVYKIVKLIAVKSEKCTYTDLKIAVFLINFVYILVGAPANLKLISVTCKTSKQTEN